MAAIWLARPIAGRPPCGGLGAAMVWKLRFVAPVPEDVAEARGRELLALVGDKVGHMLVKSLTYPSFPQQRAGRRAGATVALGARRMRQCLQAGRHRPDRGEGLWQFVGPMYSS
jgi:hypothetical protein